MKAHIYNMTYQRTYLFVFAIGIISLSFFTYSQPAYAEETATSTPSTEITTSTPQTDIATSTSPTNITTSTPTLDTPTTTIEQSFGITNHVVIKYLTHTLFDGDVFTTSTYFVDASDTFYSADTITALGVLMQASRDGNVPVDVLNFGWGYYVSSINNIVPSGFDGWIYNINFADPGYAGINDYQIVDGDVLSVFYSVWPYKVESSSSTTTIDIPLTYTSYEYTSSTWHTSPGTTLSINNELVITDEQGNYIYTPTATGTLDAFVYGEESWPTNSPTVSVEVSDIPVVVAETTSTPSEEIIPTPSAGGGTPSSESSTPAPTLISGQTIQNTIQSLLTYISNKQSSDGSIIDGPTSDWLAMSYATQGIYTKDIHKDTKTLHDYISTYDFSDPSELNLCASYPRHLLALRASGYASSHEKIQTLTQKILTECNNTTHYGQSGINDDVFGLFALLSSDTPTNNSLISIIITTIIADQQTNGAFTWAGYASPDITGAVIDALTFAQNNGISIDTSIITNAKNYLRQTQLTDGGWGTDTSDILNTSWALMGINALNESQADWQTNTDKNPIHVLINLLHADGYYESPWVAGTVAWFSMKHAIPALAGRSFATTIAPIYIPASIDNTLQNNIGPTTEMLTPTSTTPTSTIDITTTTENIIQEIATTTIIHEPILQEKIVIENPVQAILGEHIENKITDVSQSAHTQPKIIQKNSVPVITKDTADMSEKSTSDVDPKNITEDDKRLPHTQEQEPLPSSKNARSGAIVALITLLSILAFKIFI